MLARRPNTSSSNGLQHQFLSTLKWLILVIFLVTGSITWKLVSTHSTNDAISSSHLLDLPRELCGNFNGMGMGMGMGMVKSSTNDSHSDADLIIAKTDHGAPPRPKQQLMAAAAATSSISTDATSLCQAEYRRVTANRTKGITDIDLEQSRALLGNRHRLGILAQKLQDRQGPVNAVIAGGSITVGHGVTPSTLRFSERLQVWMNQYYPIDESGNGKHKVFNLGTHGADMCAMAKRINSMIKNLPPEPDLFVLEFAVNDYQGQDHVIHLDHKTDVFFEGFQQLVVCAEIVVHRLLSQFPNAVVMFLEFQTAISNRKTAATLHMAVAKHYEVPVVSYAETFFPDFNRLMHILKPYDYSTATINSTKGNGNSFTGDPVLPYPHGCVPCLKGYIYDQFRDKGCKPLCIFVQRSGNPGLKCDKLPPGREHCYVSFLAHDAVHPSAVGHQMAAELIAEAIVRTGREVCEGREYPPQILPTLGLMVSDPATLAKRSDFVYVKDTMHNFGDLDKLRASNHSDGFTMYGDFVDRPGWIATNPQGNEFVEFTIELPNKPCYVVYLAVLKSYEKMGTFTVTVIDQNTGKETTTKDVDGLWKPRISVPSDFPITQDNVPGCTGRCRVRVTTNPQLEDRAGNKVKIMTLSARECVV